MLFMKLLRFIWLMQAITVQYYSIRELVFRRFLHFLSYVKALSILLKLCLTNISLCLNT